MRYSPRSNHPILPPEPSGAPTAPRPSSPTIGFQCNPPCARPQGHLPLQAISTELSRKLQLCLFFLYILCKLPSISQILDQCRSVVFRLMARGPPGHSLEMRTCGPTWTCGVQDSRSHTELEGLWPSVPSAFPQPKAEDGHRH